MYQRQLNQLKQKNNHQGFALPEVLIAVCIFAVGFLAVASMQISASNSNRRAIEATEATTIASDQMERLMSLSFDDAELITGTTHSNNQGKYNVQWEVAFSDVIIDGTVSPNARTINMTVSWDRVLSGGSSQRSVDIDFIKPNL